MNSFDAVGTAIIYSYCGSIAHGLYIPPNEPQATDDTDYMGVCIAPIDYYFGLNNFEQYVQSPTNECSDDIVVYELRKFIRLLLKNNPNVLSLLWHKEDMYLRLSPLGKLLIDNKHLFSSQQAYYSFGGYAKAQLSKMTHGAYRGYMGDKRKKLVDKFGYDTKNASHLIRLLKMGIEFLNEGELHVYREYDREELLNIKQGKHTFEYVEQRAKVLFGLLEEAHKNTSLPEHPDTNAVNELLLKIMQNNFKNNWT